MCNFELFQNKRCNKHLHAKASAQKNVKFNFPFNTCNKEIIFQTSGSFLYPFQALVLFTPTIFAVI